jgi:copper oxidase (laccase) domain-containing protein
MNPEIPDPKRYDILDERNRESWYMTDADRPFSVIMSVHSAGKRRESMTADEDASFLREANRAARSIEEYRDRSAARIALGGNMSTVRQPDGKVPYGPGDLDDQGRYDDALANMQRFLSAEGVNVDIANVRVLNPERDYSTPLTVVNVDEDPGVYEGGEPVKLQKSGDFIYSYNPDIVFGVRPADCPIAVIAADTPKGQIDMMIHFAWRGPASGQYDDMVEEFAALNVNPESMRVYITPGGHAENYAFTNYKPDGKNNPQPVRGRLFTGLDDNGAEGEDKTYSFGIDTPNSVYGAFIDMGLSPQQIFIDTTDTTSPEAGTASHSRAARPQGFNRLPGEDNVRDIVIAKFEKQ